MPTYQYACTNAECGNRFELVQAFTDPSVTECPVCGERVRKVYGSVGVVFKGSGFYRTDSREGGKDGKSAEPAAAKSGAESSSNSSSDSAGTSSASSSSSSSSSDSSSSSASGGSPAPASTAKGEAKKSQSTPKAASPA